MTNEITNVASQIEIKNNIWTLTKHVASSVNRTAGKIDAKVYGPIVKERTVQLPAQPAPAPQKDSVWSIIGTVLIAILGFVAIVAIFIGYCSGAIKGRDILGV